MRKYLLNSAVLGSAFGAVNLLKATKTGPRDWRLALLWLGWICSLALALGAVSQESDEKREQASTRRTRERRSSSKQTRRPRRRLRSRARSFSARKRYHLRRDRDEPCTLRRVPDVSGAVHDRLEAHLESTRKKLTCSDCVAAAVRHLLHRQPPRRRGPARFGCPRISSLMLSAESSTTSWGSRLLGARASRSRGAGRRRDFRSHVDLFARARHHRDADRAR